jgi:AI-2 transport protein TqsA|tara:strand:+ start:366 stop:1436 length:1071 start_codon:yes stop_codon:yes gene_type:complete
MLTVATTPVSRFIIVAAAFVVVVAGMRTAVDLLVPFLLSVFIAVLCASPLNWMKERGVPGWLALLIMLSLVVIIGLGAGAVVGASINSFRYDLPEYQLRLEEMTRGFRLWLQSKGLGIDAEMMRETFKPSSVLALAGNTLASFGNVMTNAFMILLTVAFILAEDMRFAERLQNAHQGSSASVAALRRFTASVNRYMALKTVISIFTGILAATWLTIIGVDYPILWGVLAFFLNFIPTIGSIIAAIPTTLLALVQLGVSEAVWTAAGYLVINTVVGNMIEPRVMGRGLDLSALVAFLSLVFWGWVLGPVGMLLSIPLTVMVKIALESVDDTRWIGIMLGGSQNVRSPLSIGTERHKS